MPNENTIAYGATAMTRRSVVGYENTPSGDSSAEFIIARVKNVLLDDSDKALFDRLGGFKAIGSIECIPFVNFNDPNAIPIVARPLNSNFTQYPVKNEIVLVKTLIRKEAQNNFDNYLPEYYYFNIIATFNATEHNATPDSSFFKTGGTSEKVAGDFQTLGNVKRLIKAPGDITVESRRGSSVRLGSNNLNFQTPWKAASSKPILIISNNKATSTNEVIFEDINKDGSSLYMISSHNVGFVPSSLNFDSYNTVVEVKQNVVVVDQKPVTKPNESAAQADNKPLPTSPPPEVPVNTFVTGSVTSDQQDDLLELPEAENLQQVDFTYEDVPVSLGSADTPNINSSQLAVTTNAKLGSYNNKVHTSIAATLTSKIISYIKGKPEFAAKIDRLATKYSIKAADLMRIISFESAGKFEKAVLTIDGQPAAVGLIQFTRATLPLLKPFGINKLADVLTRSNLEQLDFVDAFFNSSKTKVTGANLEALYATIFYPLIVQGGKIIRPDSFILGSEKSDAYAIKVGKLNPSINGGNPISVLAFKNFVKSLAQ